MRWTTPGPRIEVQLKRRATIWSANRVEAVSGWAAHERRTQEELSVTENRIAYSRQ
ncbi:hypothetical protein ACFCZT_09540 [Streptomyces sp. NPDC056230]|uniref:hypothetical protein n=1 Tax=Streptomyces sp. NPDC056230 TaxID=3345754 RepID=UPI0035D969F0